MNLRADHGAVVQDVAPLSPADEAALIVGDVIVRLGGRDVRSTEDVTKIVGEHEPGDELEIEVVRGGRHVTDKVRLTKRPVTP
jgi:S1-C subfamily serine protease